MGVTRALVLGVFVLAGCGPAKEVRTVTFRPSGAPAGATVTIDDIFVGRLDSVGARGVALPLGPHHLTVEAAGYFPFDRVIEAKDGAGPLRLDVQLVPVPD